MVRSAIERVRSSDIEPPRVLFEVDWRGGERVSLFPRGWEASELSGCWLRDRIREELHRLKEDTLYPAAVGLGDVLSHPIGAEHVSCDLNDGVIGLRPRIVVVPRQSLQA